MPEYLPIRERIMRQIVLLVEAIDGVGTVRRWDARGDSNPASLDVYVVSEDEAAAEGAQGSVGVTTKLLPVLVCCVLLQAEDDSDGTDYLRNKWAAKLEAAILADPKITEAVSAVPLAVDCRTTMVDAPELAAGLVNASVRIIVEYDHNRDSPYVGPGITAVLE